MLLGLQMPDNSRDYAVKVMRLIETPYVPRIRFLLSHCIWVSTPAPPSNGDQALRSVLSYRSVELVGTEVQDFLVREQA